MFHYKTTRFEDFMLERFINFNNWVTTRIRKVRVPAENILLLIPHCLQNSDCERNIASDVDGCARCGKCDIAGILKLRDCYNIKCFLAGGGRQAISRVRQKDVMAVVAVACKRELADGIRACFPKPVLAVSNERPCGPCRDTVVDVSRVEAGLRSVLDENSLNFCKLSHEKSVQVSERGQ